MIIPSVIIIVVLGLAALWAVQPRGLGTPPGSTATPRVAVSGAPGSARASQVATQLPTAPGPPASGPSVPSARPSGPDPSVPASAPVVTPGPVVPGGGLPIDWQPAPAPGMGPVLGFTDAASAGDRVVLIGDATENFIPRIWMSTDGSTWTHATFPDATNDFQLSAVGPGGPGFVAFASDFNASAAVPYVSADGLTWQRAGGTSFADESVFSVATAGSMVIAIGDSGSVYNSADGVSWSLAQDPSSFAVGDGNLDLVSYNGSAWAFGQDSSIPDEDQLVDVWRTDDGVTWTSVGSIPGSEGTLELSASVGPKGLVAFADVDQDTRRWTAWYSADGASWQAANNSPSTVVDVIATDVGFVVASYYNLEGSCFADETQNVGVTWSSVDGLTWRQMPENDGELGRQILVLGQIGRRVVGAGVDFNVVYSDPEGDSGLAWIAELPAEATDTAPPPPPTPIPTPTDCGLE